MASHRCVLIKLALYTIFFASLYRSAAHGYTFGDLNALTMQGRKNELAVAEGYDVFLSMMQDLKEIHAAVAEVCDDISSKHDKTTAFSKLLAPVTFVPPLKNFISPVKTTTDRLGHNIIKPPKVVVCKTSAAIEVQVTALDTALATVTNSLDVFFKSTERCYDAEETAIQVYRRAGGRDGKDCKMFQKLCSATEAVVDFETKLAEKIYLLALEVESVYRKLEELERPIFDANRILLKVYNPLDIVLTSVSKLLDTKIRLPIPGGSKKRGVGKVPSCCPRGYSKVAGLCYKKCKSGYVDFGVACMERCGSGWRDIGLICSKTTWKKKKIKFVKVKLPKISTKRKRIYERLGKAPAVFGNEGCKCRKSKRYLELGLCCNKCGKDRFKGYRTSFLDLCLDVRLRKLTIGKLVGHLDIFGKVKSIPGLGDAIKFINKITATTFKVIIDKIKILDKVPRPSLKLSVKFPNVKAIKSLSEFLHTDLIEVALELTASLATDTECISTSPSR